MGPENFWAQSPSAVKIIQGLANSNSSFSDHMQMIKAYLKKQWRKATQLRTGIETPDGLRLSATVMLSHFHSLNRPAALDWYTATQYQENINDLVLWQIPTRGRGGL
ncbi:hypothetical protein FJTKL_07467 [Diaporthe vaccinii]|uniref:Uncharacterized protein n=1 Tax=Diaporthe vaccinii TaxID=105482 RepID=A0ABR4ETF8_9PEZI